MPELENVGGLLLPSSKPNQFEILTFGGYNYDEGTKDCMYLSTVFIDNMAKPSGNVKQLETKLKIEEEFYYN